MFDVHARTAALGEVVRVADARGAARQEVGVERDDDIGLVEVIDGVRRAAGPLLRRGARAVARDWIPLVPLRFRERLSDERDLVVDRRRRDGLRQEAKAGSLLGLLAREGCLDGVEKISPRADIPPIQERLYQIGTGKSEDGHLRDKLE